MDWNAVGQWVAFQTSALITTACAVIVVIGFLIIGRTKRRSARR